jgi:hypothetical protein
MAAVDLSAADAILDSTALDSAVSEGRAAGAGAALGDGVLLGFVLAPVALGRRPCAWCRARRGMAHAGECGAVAGISWFLGLSSSGSSERLVLLRLCSPAPRLFAGFLLLAKA